MRQDLSGKVAAITGAASGIGLACAKALLNEGARMALVDRAEDTLRGYVLNWGTTRFRS
jgi:ribitol 2-dehydrogenase